MTLDDRCRLPIEHPEYRYPASRNPYWKKLKTHHLFEGLVFSDNGTEQNRSVWRTLFEDSKDASPSRPLHVEIGMNAGHVLTAWARRDPQGAYIGIDWKFKAVARAAEKAQKLKLKNAFFLRSHANRLPYVFGEGEVDFLYLFFPDPWPKKAQWKHRFVSADRLRAISKVMKMGGIFHIKTDHDGYFAWMEEAVSQVLDVWEIAERNVNLHQGHPDPTVLELPDVTLFEKIFIREGIKIKSLKLRRKA